MRRLALLGLGLVFAACGSHVESGAATVDPLLALERDPEAALAAAKHPTYRATYEMTVASSLVPQTSGPPAVTTSATYIARPPDFRWDLSGLAARADRMTIIFRGADAYACTDLGAAGACYQVPGTYTQQLVNSLNVSPLDATFAATKDMDVAVLPRERIVGVDAACFRWKLRPSASAPPSYAAIYAHLGDLSLEGCFAADGVMLRSLTSVGSAFRIEQRATSISTTVTDADFALPYAVSHEAFPLLTSAPTVPQTPRPTPTH